MRSKAVCLVFSVLFAVSLFVGSDVYAARQKSGGSGKSSSSSLGSSSRPKPATPSQGSYGNTATTPGQKSKPSGEGYGNTGSKSSTPPGSSPQSPGYGNSATPGQSGSGPAGSGQSKSSTQLTPLQSQMNRSFSKQESAKSYQDYKAQQSKFKTGPGSGGYSPSGRENSTIDSIRTRAGYSSSSDYYSRRTVFYDSYRWSAPGYAYYSYPRFGIWDAMMLWFMLDHIHDAQYAAMYYNHRDDPGMQQFRKEIDRLSSENAELKSKVAKLDESSKALEQQGVKPDPSYVPQDASSVALAADFVQKQAPKSSGFPWTWVVGIGALALIIFLLMRRKS